MVLRRLVAALTALLVGFGILVEGAAVASAGNPVALTLDSGSAFAVLGHSCGGIQEQSFGSGFDGVGNPTGAVYMQTRCGGSGRGGGYHVTTYSAWVTVTWDFGGTVREYTAVSDAPAVISPATYSDPRGDTIDNQLGATNVPASSCTPGNVTYCSYRAYLTVASPGRPTAVGVSEVADSLTVTWTPALDGGPVATSTVTATPTGGTAPILSAVAPFANASTATLSGVIPGTTYVVTVFGSNAAGDSPVSSPVNVTTGPAALLPGVPTGLAVVWRSGGTVLHASWAAPSPGDSPTDDFQVQIARHDPNGPPVVLDAGALTAIDSTAFRSDWDWSVRVRAHNMAGWTAWSKAKVRFAY